MRKPFEKTILDFSDIVIDLKSERVKRNDRLLNLSPKEYDLLRILMQNPKHVVSKRKDI